MAEELQTYLLEHFQWLHRHPELALKEYETTNYVKNVLKQTEGVELLNLGLDTGALAKIEGKEPGGVVAIRADIDALPILEESGLSYSSENDGCMHACGHDFHTTALLGVAKLLGGEREHIKGTVILLFQPAEEAEHGGEKVVNTGMFEKYKIEKIFGLHTKQNMPVGTIAIAPGPFSAAVDRFLYTVKGMGCHGSAPQTGLDPIPAAARLVGSLQEIVSRRISPMETAVISVTRFTSGTSWNIIPETARLEGTVRTFNPKVREQIVKLMQAQAEGLEREGYQVEFTWIPGCPATNNDADLAELVRKEAMEGHGSAPQTGLDPIPAAARLVGSLQEIVSRRISPMETAVISVTRFTSGTSWNIIPETARLEGTVRTFNPKVREQIVKLMQAQAEGLEREGYQVEFTWIPGCPATNNDADLAELVRKEAMEEGFHVTLQHPEMGGEDFSCYQELVPGAFFHVGTGGKYPAHNSKFTVDPAALLGASKLMSEIVKKALKAS